MVRVNEEEVESLLFPVPRDTIPPRKKKLANVQEYPQLQKITLHHLIRRPANHYSQKIEEFDSLFGLYPHDITDDQVEEYRRVVAQAQLQELRQAEIVLATCCTTAAPKMAHGTNVRQIIIDDCAACKEPESLVPVILHRKAQQVVIVGDEKQLQPTVRNLTARSLGLDRSLLERYADQAVTLEEQYRMHQGISEFPALHYGQKLTCVTKSQVGPAALDIWPASRAQPIAFCHLVGREEKETVATENGVEQSVYNVKEMETVVSVVTGLVQQNGVNEERIVVVAQYSAQCQLIRQQLAQRSLQVPVNTVPDCQGHEYDYVVFATTRSVPRSQVERMPTKDWMERHFGRLADKHQVNMAITRAKEGLIIIGNKHLLKCHPMWSTLLTHYRKLKKLVDAADFLRTVS
ncbi:hypothetical protein BaRGS_00036315 [Batillaria attramentaria]|uniref:DNA2/NAM7 helicase-like C-terminal domain-containing protein n=1 Tax=Batillaria attramentaria TaxID=370345 RepID=A0ABD0JCQ5_9CAEN